MKGLKWKYDEEQNYVAITDKFHEDYIIWKEGKKFLLKVRGMEYLFKKLSSAKKVARLIHNG